MTNNRTLHNSLIVTFAILYLSVAFVSFYHACDFFAIGNVKFLSIILAASFEVAQSCVLFSLLTTNNKESPMAWSVMFVLTIVQCIGNVFAVFKYMAENPSEYYMYIQKPLLFWLPDADKEITQIVIAWVMGALLPLIALSLTGMVANNIKYRKELTTKSDSGINTEDINVEVNHDGEDIDTPVDNSIINNEIQENTTQKDIENDYANITEMPNPVNPYHKKRDGFF